MLKIFKSLFWILRSKNRKEDSSCRYVSGWFYFYRSINIESFDNKINNIFIDIYWKEKKKRIILNSGLQHDCTLIILYITIKYTIAFNYFFSLKIKLTIYVECPKYILLRGMCNSKHFFNNIYIFGKWLLFFFFFPLNNYLFRVESGEYTVTRNIYKYENMKNKIIHKILKFSRKKDKSPHLSLFQNNAQAWLETRERDLHNLKSQMNHSTKNRDLGNTIGIISLKRGLNQTSSSAF